MKDKTVKSPSIKQPSMSGTPNTSHLGSHGSDQALQAGHTKVSSQGLMSASGAAASGREKKIINEHMKLQAHAAQRQIQNSGGEVDGLDVPTPQVTGAKNANSVSKALANISKSGSSRKRS